MKLEGIMLSEINQTKKKKKREREREILLDITYM